MTGNNSMKLNQATMVQAMQLWVDNTFQEGKRPTVNDVKYDSGGIGEDGFVVNFSDRDRPGPSEG